MDFVRECATTASDLPHAFDPVLMEFAHTVARRCRLCAGFEGDALHQTPALREVAGSVAHRELGS